MPQLLQPRSSGSDLALPNAAGSSMPIPDSGQTGESQWQEHDAKRRKISLKTEMLEAQADSMRRLFSRGKGKLADVTIWCGTKSWRAHACILASRCDFFRVCMEGNVRESKHSAVWMDDDPPAALEIFLEFLYTLDDFTAVMCLDRCTNNHKVRDLLGLCKIADKYDQRFLLEQIFKLFDTQSRYEIYALELQDLLLMYKEINEVGDSGWLTRIRRAVLSCLLKSKNLKNLDAGSKKMLLESAELGFSLIELLAEKCETLNQELTQYKPHWHSMPEEED